MPDEFQTCQLELCRPGVAEACIKTKRRISDLLSTTALVLVMRYGKSNVIRQLAIELTEAGIAGVCIVLEPWIFLCNQLNNPKKIEEMWNHHGIAGAIRPPKMILGDKLSGSIDPNFYNFSPRRHWWAMTMGQAYQAQTRAVLVSVAAQCKADKRPMVVFIDECHLTSDGPKGWGSIARELQEAGALLVLLTGTPERSDNIAPFGFQMVEDDRFEFEYHNTKSINDKQNRIDHYLADRVKKHLVPEVNIGPQQAWNEKVLLKLEERMFTFLSDGVPITEITSDSTIKRALAKAVKDPKVIRMGVEIFLGDLSLRRQTDTKTLTTGIVYTGNDDLKNEAESDYHARQVKREIQSQWPTFFPGRELRIKIATLNSEGEGEQAAKIIQEFVDGYLDILIVKQMGGVGLDSSPLKVGLDLSTIRTKSGCAQRWFRPATPFGDVDHGTMVLPNDPLTQRLWNEIVTEQGGQYITEDAELIDSTIKDKNDPKPQELPEITNPDRAGAEDTGLRRKVERNQDLELDKIIAKSPIFAVRFTRRELADEYDKGTFKDTPENTEDSTAPVFDIANEVDNRVKEINRLCKVFTNREVDYGVEELRERWVNTFKRWMADAKTSAGIRSELNECRDLDKLDRAISWLENHRKA